MNTGTSLMNRVIIALLILILAALGVVIYQNSQRSVASAQPETTQVASETTEAAPEVAVEQPAEPAPPTPVVRPKPTAINRPTIIRRVASVVPAAEPIPSEATTPAQDLGLAAVAVPVPVVPVTPVGNGGAAKSEGSITGRILLAGAPPAEIPIQMDAVCGRLQPKPMTTRHYVVNSEGALGNVFVYIKTGLEQRRFAPSADQPLMDNVHCMFEPYVMGVQTGQTFRVRNSDSMLHNYHLTPKINRERNFALPIKGQVLSAKLDEPEIMARIKCDVHPWMFAYIGAVAHPFYAVSDTNGVFSLPAGLPDGTYTLAAYHLKAGEMTKEITVKSGEVQRVDFEFTLPAPKVALGTLR
jgi:hypothetical protein